MNIDKLKMVAEEGGARERLMAAEQELAANIQTLADHYHMRAADALFDRSLLDVAAVFLDTRHWVEKWQNGEASFSANRLPDWKKDDWVRSQLGVIARGYELVGARHAQLASELLSKYRRQDRRRAENIDREDRVAADEAQRQLRECAAARSRASEIHDALR